MGSPTLLVIPLVVSAKRATVPLTVVEWRTTTSRRFPSRLRVIARVLPFSISTELSATESALQEKPPSTSFATRLPPLLSSPLSRNNPLASTLLKCRVLPLVERLSIPSLPQSLPPPVPL